MRSLLNTNFERLMGWVPSHAKWCGPCHAIAPFYESLASNPKVRHSVLELEQDEN